MTTISLGPNDWGDDAAEEVEDLGELGVSVKDAGDEDIEDVLAEEPTVLGAVAADEEPVDALARLEALEKELEEAPLDIGSDEE